MPYIDDISVCPNDEIRKIMDTISSQIQNANLGWNPANRVINRFILSDISIIWRYGYNENDIALAKNFYQAAWLFFNRKDSSSAQIILNNIKEELNLNVGYYANNIYYSYLYQVFFYHIFFCINYFSFI